MTSGVAALSLSPLPVLFPRLPRILRAGQDGLFTPAAQPGQLLAFCQGPSTAVTPIDIEAIFILLHNLLCHLSVTRFHLRRSGHPPSSNMFIGENSVIFRHPRRTLPTAPRLYPCSRCNPCADIYAYTL